MPTSDSRTSACVEAPMTANTALLGRNDDRHGRKEGSVTIRAHAASEYPTANASNAPTASATLHILGCPAA